MFLSCCIVYRCVLLFSFSRCRRHSVCQCLLLGRFLVWGFVPPLVFEALTSFSWGFVLILYQDFVLVFYMDSFQSRPRFCVIYAEYSILTQNEMIVGSYWRKKKQQTKTPQNISTSKAAGNNKSKFKNKYVCLLALYESAKSRNDWCFRLRLYEYFLCQAFQFGERLDATTTFCNVVDRFTLHSLTLFRVCSCVYVNEV